MADPDPAKEHLMVCKVLDAKMEPPSPDLAELAAELEGEGTKQLTVDMVDRVLMAKLSARTLLADRLRYLKDCNKTCDEVRRDAKFPPPVLAQLPKVVQLLGNYAALSITTAELFGAESAPPEQSAATLQSMWESNEMPITFLLRIAEGMESEDDQLALIFTPLLTAACQRLQGRDLQDQKLAALAHVTQVCSSTGALKRLLVSLPVFRPAPGAAPPPMMLPGMMPGANAKPGEAFRLQTESLLGWVLSPTCLDTALHKEKSARQIHFTNLTRKSRPQVASAQTLLRSSLASVQEQAHKIIRPLMAKSSGEETRRAVLEWFGALITGTESRTKGANQIDEGGGANHFIESMENSPLPMHQNLDMRLQMQSMQARMQGFATPGLAMNTFWCLMELVKPIGLEQAAELAPFYILREEPQHEAILGGFLKETRFGDSDEVEGAKELARADGKLNNGVPKPIVQMFWLALRAVHVLFVPVMKEDYCYAVAAGYFQSKDVTKMEQSLGEHFLHETILESPAFLTNLAALLNLEIMFCLTAAFPERAKEVTEMKFAGSIFPKEVSSQWHVLPACLLEDVVEILDYYTQIRTSDNRSSDIFSFCKPELLLLLVTFMLGAGDHIKNPNLRGKAASILLSLVKYPDYLRLLETHPVISGAIVPACIRVFTVVEKTKSSYYDIRMQLKYQLRIPIMKLFEQVLPLAKHKQALKSFAADHEDEFFKFLNQMMNDATFQLAEGMDTLMEVRKLVREGGDVERPPVDSVDQDEQNADGQDIYRRSRANPKEHCKQYMKMGSRTIRTLWNVCREAPEMIVTSATVLQQLLHNCLNACLDRLIGPKCLELKGEQKDFETFNFNPKELLQFVAEMYVFVARADKEKVQKMVTEDGRSYRPATFAKAVRILRRENVIAASMRTEFETFVNELNALAASQEAALANVEIPDHYLDPIMQEIMEDPVLLPTSKNIMDRKVIERHIMSSDDDPFNRQALSVKDLIPQEELRAEIRAFCTKHGFALGEA